MALIEEKVPAEEDFIIARVNVAESAGGGREEKIMESVSLIQRRDITMPKTYY